MEGMESRGGSYMESGEDVVFFGSCDLAVSEFAVFFFGGVFDLTCFQTCRI